MDKDINKFQEVLIERMDLFAKKNNDYGSSFRTEDIVGVVIRLGDKLSRLKKVSSKGYELQIVSEGLDELFLDIANYCDIGRLLLKALL